MRRSLLSVLGLVALAGGVPAAAQRAPVAPWTGPAWTGAGLDRVERALRDRDELDLTDDQVRRLDDLRRSLIERRARHAEERMDLGSRARSGLIEDDDFADRAADLRDREADAADEADAAVDAILTEDQRDRLAAERLPWRRLRPGLLAPEHGWRAPVPPRAPIAPRAPAAPPEMHWYWDGGHWRTPAPLPEPPVPPRRRRR